MILRAEKIAEQWQENRTILLSSRLSQILKN